MIKTNPQKIVPLLKGKFRLFTKYTSALPKNARVEGSNSLKINNSIATEIIFAAIKFFTVIFFTFLK